MNKITVKSPWLIYSLLLLGIFITLEATAFVSPTLPYISNHFGISISNASIITVSYYATAIALAPLFGRLGDQRGRKQLIVIGLAIFAFSEFMAAFSPNIYIFIIARLIQGVGYACIFPNVFAYIPELFDDKRRGKAIGIFMLFTYIASGSGGVISGFLVDNYGWNAIFFVSGSFAAIGFILISLLIPKTEPLEKSKIDYLGGTFLLLTISSIICLPLLFNNFGLSSWITIAVMIIAVVSLVALINVEKKVEFPVVDLKVLKRKGISVASIVIMLKNIIMISMVYCLTFYASTKAGWSAVEVGLITTVNYSVAAIMSPIVGIILDKIKASYVVLFGICSAIIGAALFLTLNTDSTLMNLLIVMLFVGICSGTLDSGLMKVVISDTPTNKKGVGTGTFGMFKDFGIPLGASFGLTLFGAAQSSKLDENLETLLITEGVGTSDVESVMAAAKTGEVSMEVENIITPLNLQLQSIFERAQSLSMTEAIQTVGIIDLILLVVILLVSCTLLKNKADKNTEAVLEKEKLA